MFASDTFSILAKTLNFWQFLISEPHFLAVFWGLWSPNLPRGSFKGYFILVTFCARQLLLATLFQFISKKTEFSAIFDFGSSFFWRFLGSFLSEFAQRKLLKGTL